MSVEAAPSQYAEFCEREAGACLLEGEPVIALTPDVDRRIASINRAVNAEIRFVPDPEKSGLEEHWSFPDGGTGDCEDFVLEKRRRLVEAGFPGASLTCAIAFHETRLFPHALLLVETTLGTWVLDNLTDEILCWDAVPYFYARRERPDGLWTRFEQE